MVPWFGFRPLCRHPDLFAMAGEDMNAAELQQILTQILIPAATRHQSILYLAQLGKIFYCLLEETLKNQPDERPNAVYGDLSEAFHKSLFDLKILNMALLEGQYIPAARVIVLTTNANFFRGNDLLRTALDTIHDLYSHVQKDSCHNTAQWLFNEHGPYLRAEGFELAHLQIFFALDFPADSQD